MSLQDFARSPVIGSRAEQLSLSLYFGPPGDLESLRRIPFGPRFSILGVGVYYIEGNDTIVAFVEAGALLGEGERIPLLELPNGREAMSILYGVDAHDWKDCIAVGIRPPELQLSPGDTIAVSSPPSSSTYYLEQGTCGVPVTWGNNHRGFLTAGHVAHQVNYDVEDLSGNKIGVVEGVWDSAQSQTGADVAVIELSTNTRLRTMKYNGPQKITGGPANIDLHLSAGHTSAQVLGNASWLTFPSTKGTYLDLYLTGTSVTTGGDSGSPVAFAGTNDLVGHVIAGTGTLMSIIQDAQYQLSVIKTAALFSTITI